MDNIYENELEKLETESLQISTLKSTFSDEIIAASPEYWEALREFELEYPAISSLIYDYEEEKGEKELIIQSSLTRTLVYSTVATVLGTVCVLPSLAIAGIIGVGLLTTTLFSEE